ncbi:MAG: DUF948 domain-containing protein [Deltaproteobacteria bacterium]|nr:DUF948 domain-containing protein [Deltaproteobacteria bacterium]
MTITMTMSEFSLFIAAIAFLALVIALISAVRQIKRTAAEMERLSKEGTKTAENLNLILRTVGEEAAEIKEVIERLRGTGLKASDLADTVLDNLKGPVIAIIGLLFGAEAFIKRLFAARCKDDDGGTKDDKQQ